MKKILVLHTGGTIAMSADQDGAVAPTGQNPMAGFAVDFYYVFAVFSVFGYNYLEKSLFSNRKQENEE